jgi:hypothetical protein
MSVLSRECRFDATSKITTRARQLEHAVIARLRVNAPA